MSLCLINYASPEKDVLGSGNITPRILTWTLDVGECSASRPSLFNPGETVPGTH
jgi:hypothetical protein